MLQLADAGKRFGPKLLFENANWLITPDERTALVGANGTGKSTLMKILAGIDGLDYGQVQRTNGMSIGYLPQDGLALSGRTVFDECLSVFDEFSGWKKRWRLSPPRSPTRPRKRRLCRRRRPLLRDRLQFRAHDGYALDAQVGTVLTGLGFCKEDWQRRTEEFSGGWQMRIALAKLLLQKPSLLLLDEPTNHLDLETRNWLEDYLRTYPNGYILISHDRYFLDVTVNKIIEIWNKSMHVYHGNYEKYLQQKAERRTQLKPPTATSATASSSWKPSSAASATRPPRPSRCKAASRSWKRSSASRCPRKSRSFTSLSRSRRPQGAPSSRSQASRRATARSRCSTT